jgi:hypothetical protein
LSIRNILNIALSVVRRHTGAKGDLTIALWLNPDTVPAKFEEPVVDENDETSVVDNLDGLKIFDKSSVLTLKSQGIADYTTIHDIFLSSSGSLTVDMTSKCRHCQPEVIPRLANRVVIMSDSMVYAFQTHVSSVQEFQKKRQAQNKRSKDRLNIYESSALALVYTLTKTLK